MKLKNFCHIFIAVWMIFLSNNLFSQEKTFVYQPDTAFARRWSDSVLNTLSVKEKFAQMMIIRVYSNKTESEYTAVDKLITDYKIGGILFFQGTIAEQAKLTQRWQSKSKVPLFVTIDGETGLGMRLEDAMRFPTAITMGAVSDEKVIYNAGLEIGKQCRNMGIQINYAPVADVNTNPKNPVIGTRSFGENPERVATKVVAYANGMQSQGVIAVAKHFPGHGDTETDSHHALPLINHSRQHLEQIELIPFQYAVAQGIQGVMLGHLNIPALDALQKPSSLSSEVGLKLLRNKMCFNGLIMTDGLDMSGVTSYAKPGRIEIEAFLAGNDILLLPPKPTVALDSLMKAFENKIISETELNERCRKVLYYKALCGFNNTYSLSKDAIAYVLNPSTTAINNVYAAAATVLTNNNDVIPLNLRDIQKITIIKYGNDKGNFEESFKNFGPFRCTTYEKIEIAKDDLSHSDVIVAAVFAGGKSEGTYGIAQNYITHIRTIAQKKKVILVLFANPYALRLFEHPNVQALVMGYENQRFSTSAIPQILAGVASAQGKLPVSAGDFTERTGISIENKATLSIVAPEELGIKVNFLKKIDSLALLGIDKKAYPGCQILLAKDGKVFYDKSFGKPTYESTEAVFNDNIYDVASLTKIMATTPAIMKLEEQGKIDIDQTLGYYLKYLVNSDKENLVIREVMAHQSGLPAWIPFYTKIENSDKVYSNKPSEEYSVHVASNMYMNKHYLDTIRNIIIKCPLKEKTYRYSDLGMILLAEIVAQQSGMTFDTFLEKEIYQKMNIATLGFNPLSRFPVEKIMPTECDITWRKQTVCGYVHDMAAAMFGGVCGNAGIFSNAWDVGAMMQMYLQNGYYNGQNILNQSLLAQYTKQQFPLNDNRRGLGFDKPYSDTKKSPVCAAASKSSFGHSGFTGCFAWADPANGLVYIFLSNRVCPSSENGKLTEMGIRSLIHQAAYESIKK